MVDNEEKIQSYQDLKKLSIRDTEISSQNVKQFNNHYYQYVKTNMSSTQAVDYCGKQKYNSLIGYLVTITTLEENNFVKSNYPTYFNDQQSVWISGSAETERGIYRFNSGPEKGELMYNVYTDQSFYFTDWSVYEPNIIPNLNEIFVVHATYDSLFWNNVDTTLSGVLGYVVCEYGGMELPFIPTVRTVGNQRVNITNILNWNLVAGVNTDIVINFKSSTLNSQFNITNFRVVSNSSIEILIPPGTGAYVVTLSKNTLSYQINFRYQAPYISVVYPVLAANGLFTLSGDNFGTNIALVTNIQVSNVSVACTNPKFLQPSIITCTIASTFSASKPLYPIRITIDNLTQKSVKTVISQNKRYFSCWQASGDYPTTVAYASNQLVEGLNGYLGFIDTQATLNLLQLMCTGNKWLGPVYWTSLYYDLTNKRYSTYQGPYKNSGVNVFPTPTPNPTTSPNYFYFDFRSTVNQYFSWQASERLGAITEFMVDVPTFDTNQTNWISTTGGNVTFPISGGGTMLGYSYHFIYRGKDVIVNRDFFAPGVPFTFDPGYGGPYDIQFYSLSGTTMKFTPANTQSVQYLPPSIKQMNTVPSKGGVLTITGNDFYTNSSLVSVKVGTQTCQDVKITTPHTVITCSLAPGCGRLNAVIVALDKQPSKSVNMKYADPTIQQISQIGASDSWLTITGNNLPDISFLSIKLGSIVCSNLTAISPFTQVKCFVTIPSGTLTVSQTLSLLQCGNTFNSTFNFQKPLIKEATPGNVNQTTPITIFGNYFGDRNLTVTIGGERCFNATTNIDKTQIICYFNGSTPQNGTQTMDVTVTVSDGITGSNQVFYYNSIEKCPSINNLECSGNGICSQGTCYCKSGWTFANCSQPTGGNGGTPETNNNGTTINPSLVDFVTSISHLRELNEIGSPVKTLSLANNIQWQNQSNQIIGSFANETVQLGLSINYYPDGKTIIFAGETIVIPPNSIKFEIDLANWTFASALNTLEVIMLSKTALTSEIDCQPIDTTGQLTGNAYYITSGKSVLKVSFASHLFVDDRVSLANYQQLPDDDPIVVQSRQQPSNADQFLYYLAIGVPTFSETCKIDPSMQSLVLPSSENPADCTPASNKLERWKIIAISVVCSVVGVAIITALAVTFHKKIQWNKDNRKLSNRLSVMNTSEDK
ncbi:EGF-like domain-containing protein [Heterostelium album PN500]|uniref:EGF-like domain-containing protein n=1 Tax=Heterostelium pallidum (strain ATCC 26659 / Pp 5 / PN500) TaxID=670386 RepID=D3AXR7_HETP5|nr:EGF-like domain-containing protein [Heterostelium album PN500]EFA85744.1 EGF-like domain-containing protein [Heterostelium album PN500]|eukprot:XP_020437850.1 EGF-like domain-containing protein [Heterostelium album PN500]